MNHPHPIRSDLEDGLDQQSVNQLHGRFLQLNQGRLDRAIEGLSHGQRQVLTLLPLLLHLNHPLLPGHVCASTPAGIAGFMPDATVLSEAQRLVRSFTYTPGHADPSAPIHGLYLMGSLGTLAQSGQSDMDLWICHAAGLDSSALAQLRRKCQRLESWAANHGAEVHLFLIEPQGFVQDAESCCSTQHHLLLDEFYRTAIWLAGRTPLWWRVPARQEANYHGYAQALLSGRFIGAQDTLDLGHVARIPLGEFVSAGLWQLLKGVESPHKSVLKLLLTEAYASEHPQVRCLSLAYKEAVCAGQLDLDALDPYMMVYRRVEQYLLRRGQFERLELVRRSLYLKAGQQLSGQGSLRDEGWQRRLLRRLTEEWGWDEGQLCALDSRHHWRVVQVSRERRELAAELNYSYRFLHQFANSHETRGRDLECAPDAALRGRNPLPLLAGIQLPAA